MTSAGDVVWTWMHVSDIHVGHGGPEGAADQALVLAGLYQDAAEQIGSGAVPPPQAILVTGDIATTGAGRDPAEYDKAAQVLDQLQAAARTDVVYMVPGNHDVHRTQPARLDAHRLLDRLRDGGESLDASLAYEPDNALLTERLAAYYSFAASRTAPVQAGSAGSWSAEIPCGAGWSVRLIGLNSTLLANDDDDERRLRLGKAQLADHLGTTYNLKQQIVIALTHHPLSWLGDRNFAVPTISRYCDLHLHGHVHVPQVTRTITGGSNAVVTITAGAVHEEAGSAPSRHGYSFNALRVDAGGNLSVEHWPRRWSADHRFLPDVETTGGLLSLSQPLERARAGLAATPEPAVDPLKLLSLRLVAQFGQRRTGFPTDASVSELQARDLLVDSRLAPPGPWPAEQHGPDVTATLARSGSVLLLGPPGSGKTVTAYTTAHALAEQGFAALPVTVAQLRAAAAQPDEVVAALAHAEGLPQPTGSARIVWIVDGLDEALASGDSTPDIAEAVTALRSAGPVLVTCRKFDYERQLASAFSPDLFASVLEVQPWTVDGEFTDFVTRIAATVPGEEKTRLLALPEQAVAAKLDEFIARPLLARMLLLMHDLSAVTDRTALYRQYLERLAATTEAGLRRVGCAEAAPVMRHWRDIAWRAYTTRGRQDAFPLPWVLDVLTGEGLGSDCAYRIAASVLDVSPAYGDLTASFIHYSFYEFLVAQHAFTVLTQSYPVADSAVTDVLSHDLPPEMRRFLVGLLRQHATELHSWPAWLAAVYTACAEEPVPYRRTVNNLAVYLACRLGVPADEPLRTLLEAEHDPFLRNSLYWALARCDDRTSVVAYLQELETTPELASLNRGYLLYYYGDLPRTGQPPYPDGTPHVPWPNTRLRLSEKFSDADVHARVPLARQAVDLYTWCDLARARGEHFDEAEAAAAQAVLGRLAAADLGETFAVLQAVVDAVAGR
jgi:predicted MPP superfamily phosphohydrolase